MIDDADKTRSVVEFSVRYTTGVHTKGRKKGREIIEEDNIALLLPLTDDLKILDYVHAFCAKKNMELRSWTIERLSPGRRTCEFDCKKCGEHTINMEPGAEKYCSEFCRKRDQF